VIIVSNDEMHNKLKNTIKEKDFIKKVITLEKIQGVDYKNKYLDFTLLLPPSLQ